MTHVIGIERTEEAVTILLNNSEALSYPASFLPSLRAATAAQFRDYEVFRHHIHWHQIGFTLLVAIPLILSQ